MILNRPYGTIVIFGNQDVGIGACIRTDLPILRQENMLWLDEPELFNPPKHESKIQASLMLAEVVPQHIVNGMASINDQANMEASACPPSVELRFPDLQSIDTVIRWLTKLRNELESKLSNQESEQ